MVKRSVDWRLSLVAAIFVCFLAVDYRALASAKSSCGRVIVGVVDLAVVMAFHPAMRDFDYRVGKFVSPPKAPPAQGGKTALEANWSLREEIVELEKRIDNQVSVLNQELMAAAKASSREVRGDPSAVKARQELVELRKQHSSKLSELVGMVTSEFPSKAYFDQDDEVLKSVLNEVLFLVQAAGKKHGTIFVFNASSAGFSGRGSSPVATLKATSTPEEILKKWSVNSLAELEILASQSAGIPHIGKPAPQGNPNFHCGGHFESVTDPEFLRVLFNEYYDASPAFVSPFLNHGGGMFLLSGSTGIIEKDLTVEVLEGLFDRHKVSKVVREAALDVVRSRMNSGKTGGEK